jgi:hypothetical protein
MELVEDVENAVTGKELRQRYVGSGDNDKKIEPVTKGKGKRPSSSSEVFTAAGIALAAVLTVTLTLVLALHLFKKTEI